MSAAAPEDRRWLDAAVRIASPYLGTTAENPTVGAIVVERSGRRVVGRAVTARGGRPHAETQALAEAGAKARGGTLYVTLEPCNHWGETPPCADAVLAAGIGRIVIGQADPDPRTNGESIRRFAAAGLEVVVADHAPALRLHEGFFSRVLRHRPFVTAKLAVSSDGMVGKPFTPNVPITGEVARRWTHMQRALSDAVLVGGATANFDDPLLTVRVKGLEHRAPRRFVLAGAEPLFPELKLFSQATPAAEVLAIRRRKVPPGVAVHSVAGQHRADLADMLDRLAREGIGRLLVESGPSLAEGLLAAGLVDRFHLLKSPRPVGSHGQLATLFDSMEQRLLHAGLAEVDRQSLGDDMVVTFERAI